MNREKENALKDYIAMIKNSWTWHRMTEKEQTALLDYLYNNINKYDRLRGPYSARWETLHMIYDVYLLGIGYNGSFWREESNT